MDSDAVCPLALRYYLRKSARGAQKLWCGRLGCTGKQAAPICLCAGETPAPQFRPLCHIVRSWVRLRASARAEPVEGGADTFNRMVRSGALDCRRPSAHAAGPMAERVDDRTPVLVGVGAVRQRQDDPGTALEPVALGWLQRACSAPPTTADNAHGAACAGRSHPDPTRILGATPTPRHASWRPRRGRRSRSRPDPGRRGIRRAPGETASWHERPFVPSPPGARRRRAGGTAAKPRTAHAPRLDVSAVDAPTTRPASNTASRRGTPVAPHEDILHPLRAGARHRWCAGGAVRDDGERPALRRRRDAGGTPGRRSRSCGRRCDRVAASNPVAWSPSQRTAEEIATAASGNPMLRVSAYTKLLTSQWNDTTRPPD